MEGKWEVDCQGRMDCPSVVDCPSAVDCPMMVDCLSMMHSHIDRRYWKALFADTPEIIDITR